MRCCFQCCGNGFLPQLNLSFRCISPGLEVISDVDFLQNIDKFCPRPFPLHYETNPLVQKSSFLGLIKIAYEEDFDYFLKTRNIFHAPITGVYQRIPSHTMFLAVLARSDKKQQDEIEHFQKNQRHLLAIKEAQKNTWSLRQHVGYSYERTPTFWSVSICDFKQKHGQFTTEIKLNFTKLKLFFYGTLLIELHNDKRKNVLRTLENDVCVHVSVQ